MSVNRLFTFLNHPSSQPTQARYNVTLRTSTEGQPYAFVPLPIGAPIKFGSKETISYEITSHHLRIDKNVDTSNPCLSPYHYTAELVSSRNELIILHMYFDRADILTIEGQFRNGEAIDGALKSSIEDFAIQSAKSGILKLREEHKAVTSRLIKTYSDSVKRFETLLKTHVKNPDAKKDCLTSIISALHELNRLLPYEKYDRLEKLYRNILKFTQNPPQAAVATVSAPVPVKVPEAPASNTFFKPAPTVKRVLEKFDAQFQSIEKQLSEFQILKTTFSPEQEVNQFLSLLQLITHSSILSSEEEVPFEISQEQCSALALWEEEFAEIGTHLLSKLLLTKQYPLAKKLTVFIENILDIEMDRAIQTGDSDLLAFLLSNSQIDPNTYLMADVPLVQYCFETLSLRLPREAVAAILRVLVNHDASLLIPSQKGTPIAYEINNPKCAFRCVLIDTMSKTFTNPKFLRLLLAQLQIYMDTKSLSEDEHTELKRFIEIHSQRAVQLSKSAQPLRKAQQEVMLSCEQGKPALLESLLAAPEIAAALAHHKVQKNKFDSMIQDRNERARIQHCEVHYTNNLNDCLRNLPKSMFELPFNTLVASTLQFISKHTALIEKGMELIALKRLLNQAANTRGHPSRNQRRAIHRVQILSYEIQGLQREIEPPPTPPSEIEALASLLSALENLRLALSTANCNPG
jgi:hypothetical protein